MMNEDAGSVRTVAEQHGLSEQAGETLFRALVAGGGSQAQFSHPELGGFGQWSNGMTQIGDMFNDALKAKVNAFCQDMSSAARLAQSGGTGGQWQTQSGSSSAPSDIRSQASNSWWPADLGSPASSGGQNDMRYAFFPDQRRLAVQRGGTVTLYDTGVHRLSGFSQQQSTASSLAFSGQNGPVLLESLPVVDW